MLQEKVIVVTGASGALGKVVAQTALARGARVAAIDYAAAQAAPTKQRLELGSVDLTDAAQAKAAIDAAAAHFGKLDALINIAAPPNWKIQVPPTGGVGSGGAGMAWDSCNGIVPAMSKHSGGVNVCLADGSVRFVRDSIELLTWQRLGNARDGAVIGDF